MCIPVSTVPNLSALHSAARGDLVVPRTRLQLGNRAFCVAGPVAWNSLPLHIRSAPTLSTFKNMLKTHLFITFLLHWLTIFRVPAANIVRPYSSHVPAPYRSCYDVIEMAMPYSSAWSLYLRLCRPKESACVSQRNWRGTQSFRASRILIATLTASSSSFRPHEVIGRASSQSPL